MEQHGRSAKRRRSEDLAAGEPPPRAAEAAEAANPAPTSNSKGPPPPPSEAAGGGGGGGDGVDRISGIPDAVLGEIVSLLSTKEAGRTQTLASRWRHVWPASPIVLDANDLYTKPMDDTHPMDLKEFTDAKEALVIAVSRILSAHPGPGRRFCIPLNYLHDRRATVDSCIVACIRCHIHLPLLSGSRLPSELLPSANARSWIAQWKGCTFPISSSSALKISASPRAHCIPSFPAALSWSACCLKKSLGLAVSGLVPIASGAWLWVVIPLGTKPTYRKS